MISHPEARRALVRASATPSEEEAARFFAHRVSDYARALTFIFGGLYLMGMLLVLVTVPNLFWTVHLHPGKLANLGFALASAAIWQITRRPGCPAWLAAAFDLALPVGVAAVIAAVSARLGPDMPLRGLYFVPLTILALLLVLRAALVPSAAPRTALVGILASIPVIWAAHHLAAIDPTLGTPITPGLIAMGTAMWCTALAGVTALVSHVIYGLHREIASVRKLGQYVLGELIGEGGMGAVYRADHAMLRRPTAVKLLLPERAGPQNIARFEREVQLTARLTHPNTVAIYDYGRTPDGTFYYAMEYLEGLSLEELVQRYGTQPEARVIHILEQAAGALAEAHDLGLIHRDVKPANMLFCERGGAPDTVKLVDFGLVKNLAPSAGPELTQTNSLTGTPHYLAPESITRPSTVDPRVDLYALGAVGYFLLTGQTVFVGQSVLEVCSHHLHTPPETPSRRSGRPVLPELESIVMRCLAKEPEQRFHDARELQRALAACARIAPWSSDEARAFWTGFRASLQPPAPVGAAERLASAAT